MDLADKYKDISDGINDAQERGALMLELVNKMKTDLNNSEIITTDINKIKLENHIDSTSNSIIINQVTYSVILLTFVTTLQQYVTNTYTSVDNFLSDNKIKVKSTFADISETAGFPIAFGNISDVS